MKKIAKRATGVVALVLAMFLIMPASAWASLGGDSGGGGGQGSGSGGLKWRSSSSLSAFQSQASGWNYHSHNGIRWSNPRQYARSVGIESTCTSNDLVRVYWLAVGNGRDIGKNTGGTFKLTTGQHGNDDVFRYARDRLNGNGVSLICVTRESDRVVDSFNAYRVVSTGSNSADVKKTGIYSNSTAVAPQYIRDEDGSLVPGASGKDSSLKAQPAATKKTEFGKVVDKIINNKPKNVTQVKRYEKELNDALRKDGQSRNKSAQVTLSADNRRGLAEGGILNVTESGSRITISIGASSRTYEVQYRKAERWSDSGWKWAAGTSWQRVGTSSPALSRPNSVIWTRTPANGKRNDSAERAKYRGNGNRTWTETNAVNPRTNNTQVNLGFYQLLSAHCNLPGIESIKQATNLTTLQEDSTTDSGKYYALVRTPTISNASNRAFGNPNHNNNSLEATAYLGFFNKECAFECTADPNATGVTAPETARDNVSYTGESSNKGREGALIEDEWNANYAEMLRDGAARTVDLNVWFPKNVGGVNYQGEQPQSTTFVNWTEGTPNKAGESSITYTNHQGNQTELFNRSSNTRAPVLINDFISDPTKLASGKQSGEILYQTSNAVEIAGSVNSLEFAGTWASENNRPLVLNARYNYAPIMETSVPRVVGFTNPGTSVVTNYTTVDVPIDGSCYTLYGANSGELQDWDKDAINLFSTNSGSGSTNNLDSNVLNPSPQENDISNLVVKYVRVTGEH